MTNLPGFIDQKLEIKLVKNNQTMPDRKVPKAHQNMRKELWAVERRLCI